MKKMICDICGNTFFAEKDGTYICNNCGKKFTQQQADEITQEVPDDTYPDKTEDKSTDDTVEDKKDKLIAQLSPESDAEIISKREKTLSMVWYTGGIIGVVFGLIYVIIHPTGFYLAAGLTVSICCLWDIYIGYQKSQLSRKIHETGNPLLYEKYKLLYKITAVLNIIFAGILGIALAVNELSGNLIEFDSDKH
jgi:DNA-directed RNA polymerase subunit M/transcription elongation factor TFIIS